MTVMSPSLVVILSASFFFSHMVGAATIRETHTSLLDNNARIEKKTEVLSAKLTIDIQQAADRAAQDIKIELDIFRSIMAEDRLEDLGLVAWGNGLWSDLEKQKARALQVAEIRGMDPALLDRYYSTLKSRAERLLFVDMNLQASIVSGEFDPQAEAESKKRSDAQRAEFKQTIALGFVDAILLPESTAVFNKIQELSQSINRMSGADQAAELAGLDDIMARQQAVEDWATNIPLVGEAIDVLAAVSGESMNGQQLSVLERGLRILSVAAPEVLEASLKGKAKPTWDKLTASLYKLNDPALITKLRNRGFDVGQLQSISGNRLLKSSTDVPVKPLAQEVDELVAGAISRDAITNTQGNQLLWQGGDSWQQAERLGQSRRNEIVDQLENVSPENLADNDQFLNAFQNCRKDKRCLESLNKNRNPCPSDLDDNACLELVVSDPAHQARVKMNQFDRQLAEVVDEAVYKDIGEKLARGDFPPVLENQLRAAHYRKVDALKEQAWQQASQANPALSKADFLASNSVEVPSYDQFRGELKIQKFNATNTSSVADANSPAALLNAELSKGKIPMDRDVTYQVTTASGDVVDIPPEMVEGVYAKTLYENLNKGQTFNGSPGAYLREEMDHAILTGHSTDAYRVANKTADHQKNISSFLAKDTEFIAKEIAADPDVANNLGATVYFKAREWYEPMLSRNKDDAITGEMLSKYAEGMRQTTKQFDNQLRTSMTAYGVVDMPADLEKSIAIMKKVGTEVVVDGKVVRESFSPLDVEAALKKIGTTPDEVSYQLGEYYAYVQKVGALQYASTVKPETGLVGKVVKGVTEGLSSRSSNQNSVGAQ